MHRLLAGLLAAFLVFGVLLTGGCPTPGPTKGPSTPRTGPLELVIVHTNDFHGQVLAKKATWVKGPNKPIVGGSEAIAGYVRKERQAVLKTGNAFLLLDAGDIWQGTPEGTLTEGRIVVDIMNDIGYDAMAVGNHEFDRGVPSLEKLYSRAKFPWLAGNVVKEGTRKRMPWGKPFVILDIQGFPLGIVGVTADDTKQLTIEGATKGVDFLSAVETAKKQVAACRKAGAKAVLILSHCGKGPEQKMAATIPDALGVIGGHTHRLEQSVDKTTGVPIVRTWGKGTTVGRLSIQIDRQTGKRLSHESTMVNMSPTQHGPDERVRSIIKKYQATLGQDIEAGVGHLVQPGLRKGGPVSSPLGNWLADVMRDAAGADMAFHNKAGIRSDIDAGPITKRELFQLSPFSNTIVTVILTGKQVRKLLDYAFESGNLFEISGLVVRLGSSKGGRVKIHEILHRGAPIRPTREYKVATNSFLITGGDGHKTFTEGSNRQDTNIDIYEQTVKVVMKTKTVVFPPDSRIQRSRAN